MRTILIIIFIIGLAASVLIMNRNNDPRTFISPETLADLPDRTLVLNYFSRTVGTPMTMPYYELAVYTYDEGGCLLLQQYTNGGTPNEYVKEYLIPKEAYTEVMSVILKNDMHRWNDMQGIAITGGMEVCKFWLNGSSYRVTTDNMPEDGQSAFGEVQLAIESYIKGSKLISEHYTVEPHEEEPGPDVVSAEELSRYIKTVVLTRDNWDDYIELTSGMGAMKADGTIVGNVLYYVLVRCRDGYLPSSDLDIKMSFTQRQNGVESPSGTELVPGTEWFWEPFDRMLITRPLELTELTTFDDFSVEEISGRIGYVDMPEELLHEDDDGQYFYCGDSSTRYYLNGSVKVEIHDPYGGGINAVGGMGYGMMGGTPLAGKDGFWFTDMI